MGAKSSKPKEPKKPVFRAIADNYKTLSEVQEALRKAGLESSNLIIGIDFTKSNEWTGRNSFGGRCMHTVGDTPNPYQRAIDIIGRTLEVFDDDRLIPAYGFGDVTTTDKSVFPFFPEDKPCAGVLEVLQRYSEIAPHVTLSGPTSFEALINKAIEIVQRTRQYHILVIIADGQVDSQVQQTRDAIVRASGFPLSIVVVGVGDGPWDKMREFDDGLPKRRFDNFQFVDFNGVMTKPRVENYEVEFAVAALMEIPEQYSAIKSLGLM
eukprot:m51a1_g14586 putative e3 ubiquitin-protein ligase rglg2-like (266) ;mRNA; f:1133425-1134572